uniref:Myotubularin phosphatase domain-containing protein n=1 Tax=Tetranychus urticae TaxID=32264 RepID=T1K4L3_TETUR
MQRLRRASLRNSLMNNSNSEPRHTFKSYVNHFKEEEDDEPVEESIVKIKPPKNPPKLPEAPQPTFRGYLDEQSFASSFDERDHPDSQGAAGNASGSGSGGLGSKNFISSSAATLSRLTLSPSTKSSFTLPSDEDGIDLNSLGPTRSPSFNVWTDFRANEAIIAKPVDSVKRYNLQIKRSKGTIGQLLLSNRRLKFIDYHHEIQLDLERRKSFNETSFASLPPTNVNFPAITSKTTDLNDSSSNNISLNPGFYSNTMISTSSTGPSSKGTLSSLRLPPFDIHPVSEENREIHEQDIDLMNIYQVRIEQEGQDTHLTVFCNDFRSIEFQMKNNDLVKNLVDKLEQLITVLRASTVVSASPFNVRNLPESALLWTLLANQYSYQFPQDWNRHEGYWMSLNESLRIAHCNENHNMCPSLPVSFISLSHYLSDITLIHSLSPHLNGNRVPVITYCHKSRIKESRQNLLLRCSSFKMDVTNILYSAFRPLNIVEINFHIFYHRLENGLKLLQESSLLIIEENDDHYNPILSALLQIVLDEKRRSISGFESLISKEFLFLNGMVHNSIVRSPDIVLFTLFLDAVWQLICQNPYHFEFSSLYLIRLYDLQTIPVRKDEPLTLEVDNFQPTGKPVSNAWSTSIISSIAVAPSKPVTQNSVHQTGHNTPSTKSAYHSRNPSNVSVLSVQSQTIPEKIELLSINQLMFIYNPLYFASNPDKKIDTFLSNMRIDSDLFLLKLWRPLYLRWHPLDNHRQYYNYFPVPEFVYFDFLLNKFDCKPDFKDESIEEEVKQSYL